MHWCRGHSVEGSTESLHFNLYDFFEVCEGSSMQIPVCCLRRNFQAVSCRWPLRADAITIEKFSPATLLPCLGGYGLLRLAVAGGYPVLPSTASRAVVFAALRSRRRRHLSGIDCRHRPRSRAEEHAACALAGRRFKNLHEYQP